MNTNKPHIMYVDDEPINTFIFKKTMESDFHVTTFESVKDVLNQIETLADIKAIVSDFKMPFLNGIELISQIKTIHPALPCFILTAYAGNDEIYEAKNNGLIIDCLEKPINKTQLAEKIKNL